MYIKLLSEIFLINGKVRKISNMSIIDFLLNKLSTFFVPIFIILKFSPNLITILNFFLGLGSIFFIVFKKEFFELGIIIFFIFIIFDNIDGSLARYDKKTFLGKFIDALFDAIIFVFFYISISFFTFSLTNDFNLLIFGIISSTLLLIDVLILDKFSALVRWSNEQNKKNFQPYLRKKKFLRFFLILRDTTFLGTFLLIFFQDDIGVFKIIFIIICISLSISSITNVIMHLYYASKYLNFKKK